MREPVRDRDRLEHIVEAKGDDRQKAMTGNWNTMLMTNVNETNVEINESSVM